jgi:S1-C subfamily serine protease
MNDVLPAVAYMRIEQFVVREKVDPITRLTTTVRIPTTPIVGTGFVIDGNNIVTNYHVIAFAIKHNTEIYVTFENSNQRYLGKVLGYDKIADVALVQIPGDHPSVEISTHDDFRMGDPVFSISHFYGIGWSGTQGTISSELRRDVRYPYISNLQLQLLQGSGSSGGPVFNERGKVVALNRSIVSMFPRSTVPTRSGSMLSMVGYPVRGDTLLTAIAAIRKDIIVVHLDLGVTLTNFGSDSMFHLNYASGQDDYPIGMMVMTIDKGMTTTLHASDIIISIEGKKFSDPVDMFNWLSSQTKFRQGDTVNVQVYRDTEVINIAVPLTIAGL